MKIRFYLLLTNLFVVIAEHLHAFTRVFTKLARQFSDKTKAEVYKIDPLEQLMVDSLPTYQRPAVRKLRRRPHCSYCKSANHTRPSCPKYPEYLRYQNWLRKHAI